MCQLLFSTTILPSIARRLDTTDTMGINVYNVQSGGTVHTPLLIVHGESTASKSGILTVTNRGEAYPPLYYEVNQGLFKAIVHLEPGLNQLVLSQYDGRIVNGFPEYTNNSSRASHPLDLTYIPLVQNRPVHLCVLLAKDSPGNFDTTGIKQKYEGNGLDLAIRKLRVAGRLMQAYTNEQMLRAGFGNRTFNFAEEYTKDTLFAQESMNPKFRNTIKIHVIRSKKTLKELRDPNLAQQNSKGTDTGGLFRIAGEELRAYGGPFAEGNKPVQAAVMFLDTHWDPKLRLILTHAALGGGDDRFRLAIFGSHGMYSWPSSLEQVAPAFQDTTKANIDEVANDANQCGTYWECLNITMGAFLHEIGHSLGCPHQTSGIMLRDYVTFNRSFVSREAACLRTGSGGMCPLMPKDECTWHRLDLLRFLYHPCFTLPSDYNDPSFGKKLPNAGKAALLPMGNGNALLKSSSPIYSIELLKAELAQAYIEYLPKSLGGPGPQYEVMINAEELRSRLPRDKQSGPFDLKVLSLGQNEAHFKDVPHTVNDTSNFIRSDFGLGRGVLLGMKSGAFGNGNRGDKQPDVYYDPRRVVNVRVYHGMALDGIRIDMSAAPNSSAPVASPPLPERNYKSSFKSMLKNFADTSIGTPSQHHSMPPIANSVLYGNQTGGYTDFPLQPGETIDHYNLRCGGWVDAIQIVTSSGRTSAMLGKAEGGGSAVMSPPSGYEIIGFHGTKSKWVDSIGVVYVPK